VQISGDICDGTSGVHPVQEKCVKADRRYASNPILSLYLAPSPGISKRICIALQIGNPGSLIMPHLIPLKGYVAESNLSLMWLLGLMKRPR
jgi:hypothetical protein